MQFLPKLKKVPKPVQYGTVACGRCKYFDGDCCQHTSCYETDDIFNPITGCMDVFRVANYDSKNDTGNCKEFCRESPDIPEPTYVAGMSKARAVELLKEGKAVSNADLYVEGAYIQQNTVVNDFSIAKYCNRTDTMINTVTLDDLREGYGWFEVLGYRED